MKVLVLGASGATGRLVASELANRKIPIRLLLREGAEAPPAASEREGIEIVRGNIDDFPADQIKALISGCGAVVSCLGHNISLRGIFGKPRRLVYNAVKKIAEAAAAETPPKKLVLMSTTAYTTRGPEERNSFPERIVFRLLELLLPPHKDNMLAGDHLALKVKDATALEWVAVRPDTLVDEETPSAYEALPFRTRSPIFDSGKASRINAAIFMAELLTDEALWRTWRYRMPVVYNVRG